MSTTQFDNITFDLPKNQSHVIKVIGVGGGGSNAINHMFQQGINGVDFVICNTDAQALENSTVPNKIQLGVGLTEGLGAGANPEVGEQAAIESEMDIKQMLGANTKMIFITAGMGGGTGTGAAPVIAKMARELDILVVGIVTIPFQFEGKMRNEQAQKGVDRLRAQVDSLIVINNNKLREVYGNLGFKAGFSKADEVLATASRGIAEVITHHYTQNIDLRDAKTVLSKSGTAIMGSATASGTSRANEAISKALDSPLLNDNKITGAKNVLLLIVSGGDEITIDEIGEINDHIQAEAGHSANIIMGVGEDESLGDAISVTIIATGFNAEQQNEIVNVETKKIIHTLEEEQKAQQDLMPDATVEIPTEAPVSPTKPTPPQKIIHTLNLDEVDNLTDKAGRLNIKSKPENPSESTKSGLFNNYQPTVNTSERKKVPAERDEIALPKATGNASQLSMDIIPSNEVLRNIEVTYDEVLAEREEDFEIIDTTSRKETKNINQDHQDSDGMLFFDMPLHKESQKNEITQETTQDGMIKFSLDEEEGISNMEVNEPVEVVPMTTNTDNSGKTTYSLEDYMELEENLSNAKPKCEDDNSNEENIVFETKTVPATPRHEETDEEVDPMNSPISKLLIDRAAERKRKMKEFNYKFHHNQSRIDEIEKQPAYKRMGINLEDAPHKDGGLSRTSISTDDNDEIQLRRNNSFLHDNVD
ncbi:cell division protein FtsZ [Dokdonia sp. Hel_I_53]|uniref:cell division protein FtsZ n=1 Tax=Dokdonia sp. Hel_I_53 TaxID=1566287 RepID=UPI00119C6EC4|nr:cell division protein FtsZ [Dokdonia sp. Hel_I_53]TVZ51990.1 cell division protein FtsZ [Dokdonia sp. Hel_I_53]